MSTIEPAIETGRRRRRNHSALFKAEAVGACQQAGVSVAAVALARGLNANLLRSWVAQAERGKTPIAIRPTAAAETSQRTESFVPVRLASNPGPTGESIRIEVHRKDRRITIEWPASAARSCAKVLRELVK
jgi:transposase-like protein